MSAITDPRHCRARRMFTVHVRRRDPVVMLSGEMLKSLASKVKYVRVELPQPAVTSRAKRFEAAAALITER
jgi:hypothetical protein